MSVGDRGDIFGRIGPSTNGQTTLNGIEGREFISLIAYHGDAKGFQIFQGGGQIQDRFGPGANDHKGGAGKLGQVCRYIEGSMPVDSADAAGGKHADLGCMGGDQGAGHGGASAGCLGDGRPVIAAADLAQVGAGYQCCDLFRFQTDVNLAVDNADGRRGRALLADDLFHPLGQFDVFRVGQTMGQYSGFQGDQRIAQRFSLEKLRGQNGNIWGLVSSYLSSQPDGSSL